MPRSSFLLSAFMFVLALPLAAEADCMGPYPPSMVRAFNQNCAKDTKMLPFCSCIMNEVQKNIPLADFIESGNSARGIDSDPRFIKASQKCSPQLSGAPATNASPPPSGTARSSSPGAGGGVGTTGTSH